MMANVVVLDFSLFCLCNFFLGGVLYMWKEWMRLPLMMANVVVLVFTLFGLCNLALGGVLYSGKNGCGT